MASKRRLRRKSCGSKRRFNTYQEAASAMVRMKIRTKTRDDLHTYACKFCGGYHFGHTTQRVRQIIAARQALKQL
jgi:hypothetical protein